MKKLKILFSHYGIKDHEGFGRDFCLASGLVSLGHSVTILTNQKKNIFPFEKEYRDGVLIISFPDIVPKKIRSMGLGPINTLLKTIYSLYHEYDIVHSDMGHRPSSGLPCVIHRFFKKSKYVSEWWDFFGKGGIYDERPWWYQLTLGNYDTLAEIYNKKIADGVIALSQYTKNRGIKYGINKEQIMVLHGGADTKNIAYLPHINYRKKYGIPNDSLALCFIGMGDAELIGLEPFLKALNKVKRKIVINWFTTGDSISESSRKKYDIGNELIEFNWVDYNKLTELLSCADIFIILQSKSRKNTFARWPNKIGDYLAAGRLILANPVGEVANFMEKYPNSFVCVDWSIDSVENAILDLATRKNKLPNIGQINREVAEKYCSWNIKAKKLNEFYFKILKWG